MAALFTRGSSVQPLIRSLSSSGAVVYQGEIISEIEAVDIVVVSSSSESDDEDD